MLTVLPGYWYSQIEAGMLLNVRAKVYTNGKLTGICLEDIRHERLIVSPESWEDLNLILHTPAFDKKAAS